MSSPMYPIFKVGKFQLFKTDCWHKYRGYILWTGKRHIRVIPTNRFRHPFKADD